MPNFKEFLKSVINSPVALEHKSSETGLVKKISNGLTSSSVVSFSNAEIEKFGKEVINLAKSEEVITELSNDIGKPREDESEDQFVARAKSTLASILRNKLSK